jgi:hypothetical protein
MRGGGASVSSDKTAWEKILNRPNISKEEK